VSAVFSFQPDFSPETYLARLTSITPPPKQITSRPFNARGCLFIYSAYESVVNLCYRVRTPLVFNCQHYPTSAGKSGTVVKNRVRYGVSTPTCQICFNIEIFLVSCHLLSYKEFNRRMTLNYHEPPIHVH
jgi:hypothetical protein